MSHIDFWMSMLFFFLFSNLMNAPRIKYNLLFPYSPIYVDFVNITVESIFLHFRKYFFENFGIF